MAIAVQPDHAPQCTHRGKAGGFLQIPEAGADYLGMSEGQLRAEFRAGRTLIELAQTRGKSIDGLKCALLSVFPPTHMYDRLGADLDRMIAERGLPRTPAVTTN